MSLDWYSAFIGCVFVLWLASTEKDRNALRVVLIASLASELIVDLVTVHVLSAWKLVIPGAVEVLTIAALLRFAPGKTGVMNATLLLVAWAAHLLCYADTVWKTDLVYSRYEVIIQMVAVGQLATFHDTLFSIAGRLREFIAGLGPDRVRDIPAASVSADVLHNPRRSGVQTPP